jgi:hypothetical protein
MRRIAVALIGALTLVVASAPPSFAGTGWLKINAAGPATNTMNPGSHTIWFTMYDSTNKPRCSNWGKVSISSTAFTTSALENSDGNGTVGHTFTVKADYRRHTVTVKCVGKGWTFIGYITVKSGAQPALPMNGVPVLPTAVLGLTLLLVGGALVTRRPDRHRYGGRAVD